MQAAIAEHVEVQDGEPTGYMAGRLPSDTVFPPEILSHIFRVLHGHFVYEGDCFDDPSIALTMQSVCRYWRAVSLGMPDLWACTMKERNDAWVKTLLERATPSFVDIDIKAPYKDAPFGGPYPWPRVVETLLPYTAKLRNILYVGYDDLPDGMSDFDFHDIFVSPDFNPRVLLFKLPEPIGPGYRGRMRFDGRVFAGNPLRNLRSVTLVACKVFGRDSAVFNARNLTVLVLRHCYFEDCTLSDILLAVSAMHDLIIFELVAGAHELSPPPNINSQSPDDVLDIPTVRTLKVELPAEYAFFAFQALRLDHRCAISVVLLGPGRAEPTISYLCAKLDATFGNRLNSVLSSPLSGLRAETLSTGFIGSDASEIQFIIETKDISAADPRQHEAGPSFGISLEEQEQGSHEEFLKDALRHMIRNWSAISTVTTVCGSNMRSDIWKDVLTAARSVEHIYSEGPRPDLAQTLETLLSNPSPEHANEPVLFNLTTVTVDSRTEDLVVGRTEFFALLAALGRPTECDGRGPKERELRFVCESSIGREQLPSFRVLVDCSGQGRYRNARW
ncbi:unnamed protein product [Peniophora sp. CBMAI 1063]|nr:unnamed protein product [Peniophora sp. CBMAI 1063]